MLDANTRGFREDLNRFDQIKINLELRDQPRLVQITNQIIWCLSATHLFLCVHV